MSVSNAEAIIDTQNMRTGPQRRPCGYDATKKVKECKRVLLLADSEGDLLGMRIVPANLHEHQALRTLSPDLADHPTLRLIWLDRGFAGDGPGALRNSHGIAAAIVGTRSCSALQLTSGAGRRSRPSTACSVIGSCGSMTRRAARAPAA
jgi:hypothetical protein